MEKQIKIFWIAGFFLLAVNATGFSWSVNFDLTFSGPKGGLAFQNNMKIMLDKVTCKEIFGNKRKQIMYISINLIHSIKLKVKSEDWKYIEDAIGVKQCTTLG